MTAMNDASTIGTPMLTMIPRRSATNRRRSLRTSSLIMGGVPFVYQGRGKQRAPPKAHGTCSVGFVPLRPSIPQRPSRQVQENVLEARPARGNRADLNAAVPQEREHAGR